MKLPCTAPAFSMVGLPPFHVMVMPWCVMSWVWLTVTWRFLKSGYMNDTGLVGLALLRSALAAAMGLLLLSSRPCVQGTVSAELVDPAPVIWL
jgi:hypothetical protein